MALGFAALGASMAWIIFASSGMSFTARVLNLIRRYSAGLEKPEDLYMAANIILPILIFFALGAVLILIGFKLKKRKPLPELPVFWSILLFLLVCLQLWRALKLLRFDSVANAAILFLILASIFFQARYRRSNSLDSITTGDGTKHWLFPALLITAAILLIISFVLSVYFEHRYPGFILEFPG